MKICLECAEGGHLDELLSIMETFDDHEVFFVTTKAPTTVDLSKKYKVYYVRRQYETTSNRLLIYLREFLLFWKLLILSALILLKERPFIIVSTGGGSTIPLCYLGKIFGSKIIFIQSLTNIEDLSLTGKIIYPIADLFLVQWPNLTKKYKKAKYWGRVL